MTVIRRHWFALLMIAAALARLPRPAPWWYDEAFTAWLTRLPFDRMIMATVGDVHPPLFYVLEWLIAHIPGATPTALRLLPAVCSLVALYLTRRIAVELGLSEAAQAAGLTLMAVSGWQLYYAQEARSYSLSLMLYCLGAWAGLGQRWWWLFVAFAGMLYTHNTNAIMCAVIGLWALGHELRRPVVARDDSEHGFSGATPQAQPAGPIIAGAGALAMWAPWFVFATIPQMREFSDHWIWPPTVADVLSTLFGFMFANSDSYVWTMLTVIVGVSLTVVAFWRVFSSREQMGLAFLALAPIGLAVLLSYVWTPLYLSRSLIGASAPFYLLIGWAVTERVSMPARAWAAVMIVPIVAATARPDYMRAWVYSRFQPEAVVSAIDGGWRPGDVVYSLNIYGLVELNQWLGDRTGYLYPVPGAGLSGGGLTLQTRAAMGIHDREAPLDSLTYGRAWLVVIDGPGLHQTPERDALLATHRHELVLRQSDKRQANTVELYLLWPAESGQ